MNVILFPMHFIFEKEKLSTNILRNSAVTTEEKIVYCLTFFLLQEVLNKIIDDFNQTSQSSCCRAINEVSRCIAEMRPRFIYLPNNESERLEIKDLQRYGRNKEQPFPPEKRKEKKERKATNKKIFFICLVIIIQDCFLYF
ncbi:uncharacterized protein LOC129956444 [Argiope bruennichi]|uniref:uncharacterized protein LOC129956444 n=1 Tax=Argiope bruennichi TaxID=94029 RepID=UPI0024956809|nr:uncharacterized protein LOC129956444 [Argiope bruennichi]